MFNLFKKKKVDPKFPFLEAFAGRNSYFVRTAEWGLLNRSSIYVIDAGSGKAFTLEPWPQMVFAAAEGMVKVKDYVLKVSEKYTNGIPDGLDKAIIHELNTLIGYGVVKLVDKKTAPEKQFDKPRPGMMPPGR